jgi:hypothetical protein
MVQGTIIPLTVNDSVMTKAADEPATFANLTGRILGITSRIYCGVNNL